MNNNAKAGILARDFGASPYSVLNARMGWWQQRKKQWIALGIESERGRKAYLAYSASSAAFLTKEGKNKLRARQNA